MKRRLAVLAVTVSLALAGGCGGSDRGASAEELHGLVLASAHKAAGVTTARFQFSASLPGRAGTPIELAGTGMVDNAVPAIAMDMDTSGLRGDPAAAAATQGASTLTFLYDGRAFYVRFPDALAAQLGGKHWIRLDPATLPAEAGIDFDGLLAQFRSSDPLANTSLLAGAARDVKEVGEEEVRGVATRHLRLTVDVKKSLAQAPETIRGSMSKLAEALGTGTLPVDVWIDGDGLPRRLVYEVDLSKVGKAARGATGTLRTSMDLFGFGDPVEITIPPAADTIDLGQVDAPKGGTKKR